MDFEFGVARVQGEGRGVGFAGFDGAGEEVKGEEFHCEGCRGGGVIWRVWWAVWLVADKNLGGCERRRTGEKVGRRG